MGRKERSQTDRWRDLYVKMRERVNEREIEGVREMWGKIGSECS